MMLLPRQGAETYWKAGYINIEEEEKKKAWLFTVEW